MYSHDDLCFIVSAANLAGSYEADGMLTLGSDEQLTDFILQKYKEYVDIPSDEQPDWFCYITNTLIEESGTK